MNPKSEWLASRAIGAVSPDGRQIDVMLRLGMPYEVESEEWACPVAIEGLQEKLHDIHGVDAWQAIQLAQNLLVQLLGHYVEEGGRLVWPGSLEPLALGDVFPGLKNP